MKGGRLNLSPLYYRVSPERIPQMSDLCGPCCYHARPWGGRLMWMGRRLDPLVPLRHPRIGVSGLRERSRIKKRTGAP